MKHARYSLTTWKNDNHLQIMSFSKNFINQEVQYIYMEDGNYSIFAIVQKRSIKEEAIRLETLKDLNTSCNFIYQHQSFIYKD